MIRINLLGTERARARTRAGLSEAQKITAVAALIMLLTAGYIVHGLGTGNGLWTMNRETARLDQELAAAEQEAQRLRGVLSEVQRFEAQKSALTQRVALIEELRRGQTGPVHMLDEISRALPERLWLVEMTQKGDEVSISDYPRFENAWAKTAFEDKVVEIRDGDASLRLDFAAGTRRAQSKP